MLPSRHAAEAYRKMALFERHHPENFAMLICTNCGRKGKYDIGALVVNPHNPDPFSSLQCTGYFRCKHCNAAGGWDMPPLVGMQIIGLAFMRGSAAEWTDDRVIFGSAPLYDGYEGK
ncbi:Tetratricopeptide TPR_2 repeat protein, partial [mine drainage metagenome]